jgi:hypothetical protein
MALLRCYIVDTRVQVLCIIPLKIGIKILTGSLQVPETTGIAMIRLYCSEQRLNKRVIVGGPWTGKQLGHTVIFKEFPDGFGLHLAASIIDYFGTLILGQIKDIFTYQSLLNKMTRFTGSLMPAD